MHLTRAGRIILAEFFVVGWTQTGSSFSLAEFPALADVDVGVVFRNTDIIHA